MLGLDIGEKRIGVALSDATQVIATPLKTIDAIALAEEGAIPALLEEYEVELVVVGLPVSLDGTEGEQARRVREVAGELAERLPVPVVYQDERLSSAEAKRHMAEAGLSSREMRGKTDMLAAALFLQSYLDRHGAETEADDG